mmetsp:Transcript_42119/g.164759  ORF Transcript_42119/g.164759 Transcript_42119/m.164759 type:complete len:85 (-) Transcript_42119:493-747(-)
MRIGFFVMMEFTFIFSGKMVHFWRKMVLLKASGAMYSGMMSSGTLQVLLEVAGKPVGLSREGFSEVWLHEREALAVFSYPKDRI